jgi:Deoxyinosine 3''endonuclease (endonuclease V)
MILAADVQYGDTGAQAAGVLFTDWPAAAPERTLLVHLPEVAEYVPGEFYRRELPCLLRLGGGVAGPLSARGGGGPQNPPLPARPPKQKCGAEAATVRCMSPPPGCPSRTPKRRSRPCTALTACRPC